jgi:pyruvate kinase
LIQKSIIRQARAAQVPVIVATQMLESMTEHRRPTRAEVSDVATAIFDGADAIMLSAETATGRYPAETVQVMARIAERAEQEAPRPESARRRQEIAGFTEAVADAARHAVHVLQAAAIVTFTRSGASARFMSQQRPQAPIIALTPFPEVRRRLALCWGVTSRLCRQVQTMEEMLDEVDAALLADGTVKVNDTVVIISGAPMWVSGTTNLLKLHRVGERR